MKKFKNNGQMKKDLSNPNNKRLSESMDLGIYKEDYFDIDVFIDE